MKRKWLVTTAFVLIAVSLVFCCNINMTENTQDEPSYYIEEKGAEVSNVAEKQEEKKAISQEKAKEEPQNNKKTLENKDGEPRAENTDDEKEVTALECTLLVRCNTVFDNMTDLDKEKVSILPADGVIFPETKVVFYDGESVFNVLTREMKKNKIHLDFVNTTMYKSVYIKGISNLYEYDCGELSGWIYAVNGKVPNCGCSQYILKSGDEIEFIYTCDLGRDIGF